MTERLYNALIEYYMGEFEMSEEEAREGTAIDDFECGLECTTLNEVDEDGNVIKGAEAHELETTLIPDDKIIIYEIDGETVGVDEFESEEELADYLETLDYDGFYKRGLDFAPENYA